MAAEAPVKASKPMLTTRNVTLVSYQLDETQSSEDQQAEVLSAILMRLGVNTSPKYFESYLDINKAIQVGDIAEGQFVLYYNKEASETLSVVVAKYRNYK